MKCITYAVVAALLSAPAFAADLPLKAAPLPVVAGPTSGLWLEIGEGGAISKNAVNDVTITGQTAGGGSFFPVGHAPSVGAGYDMWLGSFYLAPRASYTYDFARAGQPCASFAGVASCTEAAGSTFRERFDIGITASGFTAGTSKFTPAVTIPPSSQWPLPITVPSSITLANILPYATVGAVQAQRRSCVDFGGGSVCGSRWDNGLTVGGGVKMPVAAGWTVDIALLMDLFNKSFTPASAAPVPTFEKYQTYTGQVSLKYNF